jgi:hypothetical protein
MKHLEKEYSALKELFRKKLKELVPDNPEFGIKFVAVIFHSISITYRNLIGTIEKSSSGVRYTDDANPNNPETKSYKYVIATRNRYSLG